MKKWLKVLAQFGPQILVLTPLAPIAPSVTLAIHEAQLLKGATGPERKAHALAIVQDAANAANAQAGHPIVDVDNLTTTAGSIIDSVVLTVNTIDRLPLPQVAP